MMLEGKCNITGSKFTGIMDVKMHLMNGLKCVNKKSIIGRVLLQ